MRGTIRTDGDATAWGAAIEQSRDQGSALRLVDALSRMHAAGLDLTRRLCAARALADASEELAHRLVEDAAETPWDEQAIRRAVAASAACEAHAERERAVSTEWAAHRVSVELMLEEAAVLLATRRGVGVKH
jgi:hypothetical protein